MLEIVKMLEMMKMLELFSLKRGTVGAPYVKKVPQVALYLNLILLFSYGVAFGFADYNLLDKFVYQLWRQLRKLRNRFCFFNKTL